jgi:hypothetical protein
MQEVLQREEQGKAAQLAVGRIKAAEDNTHKLALLLLLIALQPHRK